MPPIQGRMALVLLVLAGTTPPAAAQLRVVEWNVSNYPSSTNRDAAFQTAVYGVFQGRSLSPDIFIGQEFTSSAGNNQFLTLLNTAPGSPGDWAAAPFVNGPDTDSAFFYRSSKVTFLGVTVVLPGSGNGTNNPRNVQRYDVRPVGYSSAGATLAIYSSHMKAGSSSDDQSRRLYEATAIRNNANSLTAGWQFLIGGDFNIQSSTQAAYQQLVGSHAVNRGQFVDPIKTPGTWNNSSTYRYVHTQAPGAQMDDRFDMLLVGGGLVDGNGFEYIGNSNIAFSNSTWNDPNHSFRCWGNDGTSFNGAIKVATNQMVGPTIAQALIDAAATDSSGGHLPVYLDLRVPARVAAPALIDLGDVAQNSGAQADLPVGNGGDVAKWNATGIATLRYSLEGSGGVVAPGGQFTANAGAAANTHVLTVDTSVAGPISGLVTISSDDPEAPTYLVSIQGTVVDETCYPNCDGSTQAPVLNVSDFTCFLQRFAAGEAYANCDGSTQAPVLNVSDFTCFLQQFAAGCP